MIISQLQGGLGNQMFQYAAGRALSFKQRTDLILDTSILRKARTPRYYALAPFCVSAELSPEVNLWNHFIPKYYEKTFSYDPTVLTLKESIRLCGYWQSERYFKEIAPVIRGDFTLRNMVSFHHVPDSVSIHIRRGDYVIDPETTKMHGNLPMSYYHDAVDLIREQVESPYFYIFSDDPKWVEKNFKIPYPHAIMRDLSECVDLMLMAGCQHHIIANSSFSWWGAWLGINPDKIIVAPKKWFANGPTDTQDLIPKGWLQI